MNPFREAPQADTSIAWWDATRDSLTLSADENTATINTSAEFTLTPELARQVAAALLSWADAQEKRSANTADRQTAFMVAYRDAERRGNSKEACIFAGVEVLR